MSDPWTQVGKANPFAAALNTASHVVAFNGGEIVYCLYGQSAWANVWASNCGWSKGAHPNEWLTPKGVRIIGVRTVNQVRQMPRGAWFTLGPFFDAELLVEARLRGCIEVTDNSLGYRG